eukprot:g322.t1
MDNIRERGRENGKKKKKKKKEEEEEEGGGGSDRRYRRRRGGSSDRERRRQSRKRDDRGDTDDGGGRRVVVYSEENRPRRRFSGGGDRDRNRGRKQKTSSSPPSSSNSKRYSSTRDGGKEGTRPQSPSSSSTRFSDTRSSRWRSHGKNDSDGYGRNNNNEGNRKNRVRRRVGVQMFEDKYEKIINIGTGTYGEVFRAKRKKTGDIFAIKKVKVISKKNKFEGVPKAALREIKALNFVKKHPHRNVVRLFEIVAGRDQDMIEEDCKYYLVLEYVDHDLTGILDMIKDGKIKHFDVDQVKTYMYQLLSAMKFLHSHDIIHRDLKCSNILVTKDNVVKLADFGLAIREKNPPSRKLSDKVVTLWYRPAELFLGSNSYHAEIDMWSVGAIFAEIMTAHPLFPKKTDFEMLVEIFRLCGFPSSESWKEGRYLPQWGLVRGFTRGARSLRESILKNRGGDILRKNFSSSALDLAFALLDRLLQMNPQRRATASEALEDEFLRDCKPARLLPVLFNDDNGGRGYHEQQTKEIRRAKREEQNLQQKRSRGEFERQANVDEKRRRRNDRKSDTTNRAAGD